MNSIKNIVSNEAYMDYILPFPYPGGWALAPDSCKFLGCFIRAYNFENILEFGSGYSSLIVGYELERSNQGHLISIDNSNLWIRNASNFASRYCLSHRITFHRAKLTLKVYKKYAYIFYDIHSRLYKTFTPIDFVIVDAPHHDVGREGAIYEVYDRVREGGYLFIDDCNAEHMQRTLRRWEKRFPKSIDINKCYKIGNGISLIQKVCKTSREPCTIADQFITGWIRAIRNYFRIYRLRLND